MSTHKIRTSSLQQTSSPLAQRWMAKLPRTQSPSGRSTSVPGSTPSLPMVLISHTKASLANHLLLPRAPCREPLDPAARATGLACRGPKRISRTAASSARSKRRTPDSSPFFNQLISFCHRFLEGLDSGVIYIHERGLTYSPHQVLLETSPSTSPPLVAS